ncbi:hypothetical protein F4818DRAFT_451456 [Hypoxylon cercidicola]|nr:hypothetical protein F4818DRAFT_451456 [Hypoxylon cercidicola]
MAPKEIAYEPLKGSPSPIDNQSDSVLLRHYDAGSANKRWKKLIWTFCIAALVLGNMGWASLYYQMTVQGEGANRYPIRVPHQFMTPFGDDNLTLSNGLWATMFPAGYGAIVVDHEWAAENHIAPTKENATDGRAVYAVAAFHHLHCLAVLRTSLYQYKNEREQINSWFHVRHCIDALRQLILCSADPTIIGGESAWHECRDWYALKEWIEERAYVDIEYAL